MVGCRVSFGPFVVGAAMALLAASVRAARVDGVDEATVYEDEDPAMEEPAVSGDADTAAALLEEETSASDVWDPENQQYDISGVRDFDEKRVWVCDIEEKPGEADNDFLFVGDVSDSGEIQENYAKDGDTVVFGSVMY